MGEEGVGAFRRPSRLNPKPPIGGEAYTTLLGAVNPKPKSLWLFGLQANSNRKAFAFGQKAQSGTTALVVPAENLTSQRLASVLGGAASGNWACLRRQ